jgi:amino acid adenylation domain-containing protein
MTQTTPPEVEYIAPPSFGQQRLWLLDQMLPDKTVYNEWSVYGLTGALDAGAFARAVDAIVARHDVLRTGYAAIDGELRQIVLRAPRQVFALHDLTALPITEREAAARRLVEGEVTRPHDLERGEVIRVVLLRVAPQEHWMVVAKHHITYDRWSRAVFDRELATLYAAFLRGESSPLPALPVQYADYAEWQRAKLDDATLARLLAHWTRALADLPALDLPTDRPRPAVATFRGAQAELMVDGELAQDLASLARREGVTMFMLLMAAFQVLLYRYSGQDDFAVGTVSAGRDRIELEGLIGFLVNTLVVRADLSGAPSFRAQLARVRQTLLETYGHAALPFERLVERLAPSRDLSRNPVFQVALRYANAAHEPPALTGIVARKIDDLHAPTAKYDLSFGIIKRADGLELSVEYAVDLFDAATMERMLGHFRNLLHAIVADPDQAIAALPMQDEPERRRLLFDWNDTAVPLPTEVTVTRWFEEHALRAPDATAVEQGERRISYGELKGRVDRLAQRLRAHGVKDETLVAVAMERSFDWIVAMLAIWKAGGAYLPLDPTYPKARLAVLVEDAGALVLLTQRHLEHQIPPVPTTLFIDTDLVAHASRAAHTLAQASGATLAYLIHTSGSTGQPKGVMIEHRSLANHLRAMQRRFPADESDCVLVTAALGFDQSIWQVTFPLISGARVALPVSDAHLAPDDIVAAIRRHRVTTLRVVPTLLASLLEGPGLRSCPSLRVAIVAGEVLDRSLVQRFAVQSGARLVNAYGPTEATFVSLLWECRDGDGDGSRLPIGRPIDNVHAYVLDRHRGLAPIGGYGEMYLGGAGVGRGYCGVSEATAQAFIADPFAAEPGARLYRTGDIVRYRGDGNLEFIGRCDGQVKIRGVRIELGEIEAALATRPEIQSCVVDVWRDAAGEARLVAYFVTREGARVDAAALREYLRERLPAYMVPLYYVELADWPLTVSGKIKRSALPSPTPAQIPAGAETARRPRSAVEDRIATIFAEVLKLDRVEVDQDFFDLGGHSLLAMQVLSRIEGSLGAAISLRHFFSAPNVSGLAGEVTRLGSGQV